MANNDMDRVVPLSQLDDFKVADGDPDVRGWEVLASDGRKIGEVDELLVDTNAMKVRYLDVDVEDGVIGDGMDRHVLIPIGYARLEQERDCVMVDGLASADLQALPAYDQGPLTRDFESSVRNSFSGRGAGSSAGMAGAGMMDTAGLDNTPGMGTGLGMAGAAGAAGLAGAGTNIRPDIADRGESVPDGEGMRAAGYDLESGTHSPLHGGSHAGTTGSLHTGGSGMTDTPRDTGSQHTGLSDDLGVRASGTAHGGGLVAPTDASTVSGDAHRERGTTMGATGGMSAGATSGSGAIGGGHRSEMGGTGRGDGMLADADQTLVGGMSAGAGSQGPVAGMGTDRGPQGDMSHSTGLAGSDYLHNADEDFYASDAFDDNRFYGSRRGGLGDSMGADRDETRRLAQDASERLREDHRNRGVGGSGSL